MKPFSCSKLIIIIIICFFLEATAAAAVSPPNITLYGDAHSLNHTLHLTRPRRCPVPPSSSSSSSAGTAFYLRPIRFLDPANNFTTSFSSRFTFSIVRSSPLCPPGDGLAFLLVSTTKFTSFSGNLGLPKLPRFSKDSFVAVEFDTHFDSTHRDISGNHVGVDINSVISFASADAHLKGVNLVSGKPITAWIEYSDAEKQIRVWLSYSSVMKPPTPVLDAPLDLSKHLREFMYVGFSASNGQYGSAVHVIDQWRFKTIGLQHVSTTASRIDDGDCFMCPPVNPNDHEHGFFDFGGTKISERNVGFFLGGLVGVLLSVMVIAVTLSCYAFRTKRRERSLRWAQMDQGPRRVSLSEIKYSTARFCKERIIGEGASATVYLGFLLNGKQVAVKRFNQQSRSDGFTNPFTTEFATMARCLRHRNLVQLIGWCCERKELVLVYEYLPNGNLDQVLHGNLQSIVSLTWEQRMTIVLGISSALTYLHEECDRQIIHRDVKACNILLDADFTAKLGDFGLAEIYDHSSTVSRDATVPAGTVGYLAPEYAHSGIPTVKTDVYSFGVVILEVGSGRKPVNDDGVLMVDWIWELWEEKKLMEAVDPKLMGRYSRVDMERLLKVGMWCAHPNCDKRPTVKEAARMLQDKELLPMLPAKKPAVKLLPAGSNDMSDFGDKPLIHAFDDSPWLTPRSHFG